MNLKTPYLAVDGIILIKDDNSSDYKIILIERKNDPKGLALPGGFVDYGESAENALKREMKEELNLDVEIIDQFRLYSDPNRDPRMHVASMVFICKADGKPKASDDAKAAYIYDLNEINYDDLVFDHAQILKDFLPVYRQLKEEGRL